MKKTIYKYIFFEFLRYFFITLFAVTVIFWAVQSVNFLDLVTEDGHAFSVYFLYSFLTLSKIVTKLIPLCFLISITLTIAKLEDDNELIVIWTSGLNKIYIVNLFFRISLIVMLFQLMFTSIINPSLLNISRSILKNSQLQFVPSLLKERQFNDTIEKLTIFVDEKDLNQIYKNIFIRDDGKILSEIGSTSSTIFAKSGYIDKITNNLILYNGHIQKLNDDGGISIINFKKTQLDLKGLSTKSISEPKMQETSTINILLCLITNNIKLDNCNQTKKSIMDNKIEVNKRFGLPILVPLIALVCSFLLSTRKDQKFYNYNKHIYIFIGLLIIILTEMMVRYSGFSWKHLGAFYLFPLTLLPVFYFTLIKKFKYENLN
jgi:lipopolysaccharide export system permease protein